MSVALRSTGTPRGAALISRNGSRTPGLSDKLNPDGIDVPQADESSVARLTRSIVGCIGGWFTPVQVLILLRILRTVTFLVLIFTIIADAMYIFFVKFLASSQVDLKVGGPRDTIIRTYGLFLAALALAFELDHKPLVRHFSGLRRFIPRSFLLFFLAAITSAHPLHGSYKGQTDDYIDDQYDQEVSSQIPHSTVAFQMVTSFVLFLSSVSYLVCGLLCFDRFTSDAFLSHDDPVQVTKIPPSTPTEEIPGTESDYVKV